MDDIIAFCYLGAYGDEQNKAWLTGQLLIIRISGIEHIHPLAFIIKISLENRKMLYYIAFGGIIASLSLVAIATGTYHPWLVLLALFIGIFLFFYGWKGRYFLVIQEFNNHSGYFIRNFSPNLEEFIQFVNESIHSGNVQLLIYHLTTVKHWQDQENGTSYVHPSLEKEGFIHASLHHQVAETKKLYFSNENNLLLLTIDATRVRAEVKFEKSRRGELFPHIYGALNKDAVIETGRLT